MKKISEIPQIPMDCWQVAAYLYGQAAVDADHSLASKAAQEMRKTGWTFLEYDPIYGEEVWQPYKA